MFRTALCALLLALTLPAAAPALSLLPEGVLPGAELQSMRFCRPGERPTSPRQCLQRGRPLPLR